MDIEQKLVEVVWLDAALESCQLEMGEAHEIEPIERANVGYLLCNNKRKVVICFGVVSHKYNRVADQTLVILKSMVTSIKILDQKE